MLHTADYLLGLYRAVGGKGYKPWEQLLPEGLSHALDDQGEQQSSLTAHRPAGLAVARLLQQLEGCFSQLDVICRRKIVPPHCYLPQRYVTLGHLGNRVFLLKDKAQAHQVLKQLEAKVLHFKRRPFAGELSGQSRRPMHLLSLELQSTVAVTMRSRLL